MTNLEIIKRLKTAKDLYDKDTKPGSDKNGGNVQGDIDANSVKVKGRYTGNINV